MAEGSASIPQAGPWGTFYCCKAWGTLACEHPEAHQHEGAQTGLILLLSGCFLLLDCHLWDLLLLSSLVSLRITLSVHGDLMGGPVSVCNPGQDCPYSCLLPGSLFLGHDLMASAEEKLKRQSCLLLLGSGDVKHSICSHLTAHFLCWRPYLQDLNSSLELLLLPCIPERLFWSVIWMGWDSTCGTVSESLGGVGSPLRLHPMVSSLPRMLEQGSGYGQANASFAAVFLEKRKMAL